MAIKGSLKEASLPDVLQLLALGQKTGCLSIADRGNFGYIYFDSGKICYASIVNRRDRLGDILVKQGKISRDQLDDVIDEQGHERERRLGELLENKGLISHQELEHYVRLQIEEAVYFLFTWTQGTFNFEADVRPDERDLLVSINPEALLLEGARRVDEWGLIEKKIPSFDLIFSIDREHLAHSDVTLTDEQERIVDLIDGRRDVNQLVEDSGLAEFDVGKAIYGLLTAGFIQRVGRTEVVDRPEVTDTRIEEHRNLGIAFYRTGMLDEAAREFRRVAELRPSEYSAHFYLGLVALRQSRWDDAVGALQQAAENGGNRPAIVHNLALAHEQLRHYDEADAAYSEAATRARDDTRILTGWGVAAMQRGDYQGAAGRLDRAREVLRDETPPALWYWARTLAAAGQEDLPLAHTLAREGVERHPQDPVLRNNLAVLLELLGELDEAERILTAAIADTPSLPQLSKNLGDVRYRGGWYDDAWTAFKRAVGLDPELGDDVYFKMGNIAYKRNEREEAVRAWRKALELNPDHELARANVSTVDALT